MKAVVIHKFGDVDVLKYENIETPEPMPGHILIKILATGANRFDHYIREGSIIPVLPFPHILGSNAAGEVAELGKGVTEFNIGERVIPMPGYPMNEKDSAIRPASITPSFTLSGLSAWGTYAQYMEMPAWAVLKDNSGLSPALKHQLYF